MSKLIMIAGTKGGIGKSFVAALLADVAMKNGKSIVLFDCDDENHTLRDVYSKAQADVEIINVQLETDREHQHALDVIVNDVISREDERRKAGQKDTVYIADMKAGTSYRTIDWMRIFPFDLFRTKKVDVLLVGIVTTDIDSVITLAYWIRTFTEAAKQKLLRLVVVRNDYLEGSFDFFDRKLLPALKDIPGTALFSIDNIGVLTSKRLRDRNATVAQAFDAEKALPGFEIMDDIRCREYYYRHEKKILKLFSGEEIFMPMPGKEEKSKEMKNNAG